MTKSAYIIGILLFLYSCNAFRPYDEEAAIAFTLDQEEQLAMGHDSWTGPDDCSATAYLNKSTQGLLLTIFVRDDSVNTGNDVFYMNDGVELYFDFRPPRLRSHNYYEKGVAQAIILPQPGKKKAAPVSWYPKSYDSEIRGATAYTEVTDTGYLVQVNLPASGISRAHYWPRTEFYMDLAINDADTGRRESQIMWAGKADNWNKPHNFRSISLPKRERENKKMNMVVIITNGQSRYAMSGSGNPYLQTPLMDGLAANGTRFNNYYSTSPSPSFALYSLLTGIAYDDKTTDPKEPWADSSISNIGQIFRQAGYNTVWAGKWGFPEEYPHDTLNEVKGFKLLSFLPREAITFKGSWDDPPLTDAVVKFIKGRRKDPFLLVVAFQNPSGIQNFAANPDAFPPPLNPESTPPIPENFRMDPLSFSMNSEIFGDEEVLRKFTRQDWRNYLYHYYRLTEMADKEIEKIISAIEKEGLDENTLIVFTSINGTDSPSNHWSIKHGSNEGVNTPLLITLFGSPPESREVETLSVSELDILPTLLDYADIEIPAALKGRSLKPETTFQENPLK